MNISDKNRIFTPVENYNGVLQFICADVHRSITLSTYLKNELTEIFGKHNKCERNEFLNYVWLVESDGETFKIYTAKNKGTSFLIEAKYDEDKANACIKFLTKMETLLKMEKYSIPIYENGVKTEHTIDGIVGDEKYTKLLLVGNGVDLPALINITTNTRKL